MHIITSNLKIPEDDKPIRIITKVLMGNTEYTALWDTGATNTVVNKNIIDNNCDLFEYVGETTITNYNSVTSKASAYTVNIGFICDNNKKKNIKVKVIDRVAEIFLNQGIDVIIGLDIILKQELFLNNGVFQLVFSNDCEVITNDLNYIICNGIGINGNYGRALLDTANFFTMAHSTLIADDLNLNYRCSGDCPNAEYHRLKNNCSECNNCIDEQNIYTGNNIFLTIQNSETRFQMRNLHENTNNNPFKKGNYELILGMDFILNSDLEIKNGAVMFCYQNTQVDTTINQLLG